MPPKPLIRRAQRSSRPEPGRFFTLMVVFSHRTFRWSISRKTLLWTLGVFTGIWMVATIGSGYGLWATKKLMSFSQLQKETMEQQRKMREALVQAQTLEDEIRTLRQQTTDLLSLIDPKAPKGSEIAPAPAKEPGTGSPDGKKISAIQAEIDRQSTQARLLRARMEPVLDRWMHTPSIPPTAGYFSSSYGVRISPFSRRNEAGDGLLGWHSGIDVSNDMGTPIQATADGSVASAGWWGAYGWTVVIQHSEELETLYAHLAAMHVREGQRVNRGDILGTMGRSGNATGVHLHYEVRRRGKPVDPKPYLRLQREWLSTLR